MSINNDPKGNEKKKINNFFGSQKKQGAKLAIVAGILATGILAAALTSNQILNAAMAQTTSDYGIMKGEATSMVSASMPYYHGNYGGLASTISTSGTATTQVKPDKVSVTVGVETNGTTAQEATSKNADLMAQVIAALKGLGITDGQIATSNFNVYPVYGYNEPVNVCKVMEGYPIPPECYVNQELTGYRASNSVTVTLDVQGSIDAGKVIDASVNAGANNVNGVYFFVSPDKQDEVRDSLTKEAIANARHRADVAAGAIGMKITGVQSVNLNDVYFPVYSYYGGIADAQASTPIQPGEQQLTNTVSVVFYFGNGTTTTP